MKMNKLTKRILACGLAFSVVVSGSGLQSGTASAAKKKKAKTVKVSVTVGKTKTLKAGKTSKKVTWSTSNKKVVKITKTKGKKKNTATIKGVKKGTATVTAKMGKTKKTWKVTVKAPATNIASVGVDPLDGTCLVVKLKKAAAVNVSDLTIGLKEYNEGKYNYEPTVKTLTSTDQITYRIYLSRNIYNGEYIKLSLGKKDVKEVQCKRDIIVAEDVNILMEKDATFSRSCGNYFSNTIGTVKYTLKEGTLPEGIVLNSKRGLIKGIPTAIGTYPVKIQATDEMGRTAVVDINFMTYDKTVIVCPNSVDEIRLDDYVDARKVDTVNNQLGKSYYDSIQVSPKGGSGVYKFSLAAPDIPNVRLSTDVTDSVTGQVTQQSGKSTDLLLPYEMTDGVHTYTITITDEKNPQLTATTTVSVNAVRYYNIKGNAKDVNGAELSGNSLYFYPVDAVSSADYVAGHTYTKDGYYDDILDCTAVVGSSSDATAEIGKKKGTYSTELAPGEYIVKVRSEVDGIRYQMSNTLTVGAADAMLDVAAPVRFYSVSGIATYANGNPVTEQYVYFETKDEQFENYSDMKFSVKTDAQGAFIASLPANNYAAYVLDEGKRKYFGTDIAVVDADVTLSQFKLAISRTIVTGTASNGTNPMKYYTLEFINPDGDSTYVETDANGVYKAALAGTAAPGTTYIVKANIGGSDHQIGTVTVLETDVNLTVNLTYSFANEVLNAPVATLGSDLVLTSNGTNDLYAKIEIAESGSYQIRVNSAVYVDSLACYVLDSDGYQERSISDTYTNYVSDTVYLSQGTYYVKVNPRNRIYSVDSDGDPYYTLSQVVGNFTLNISKNTSSFDD